MRRGEIEKLGDWLAATSSAQRSMRLLDCCREAVRGGLCSLPIALSDMLQLVVDSELSATGIYAESTTS